MQMSCKWWLFKCMVSGTLILDILFWNHVRSASNWETTNNDPWFVVWNPRKLCSSLGIIWSWKMTCSSVSQQQGLIDSSDSFSGLWAKYQQPTAQNNWRKLPPPAPLEKPRSWIQGSRVSWSPPDRSSRNASLDHRWCTDSTDGNHPFQYSKHPQETMVFTGDSRRFGTIYINFGNKYGFVWK